MRSDMTLGEVKDRCAEMTGKYGDSCCNHCDFGELGCCNPPDEWKLEELAKAACAQPNWEEMYCKSEEACRQMYMKVEDAAQRAARAEDENRRLRTIVSVVETMLGRKFEC